MASSTVLPEELPSDRWPAEENDMLELNAGGGIIIPGWNPLCILIMGAPGITKLVEGGGIMPGAVVGGGRK